MLFPRGAAQRRCQIISPPLLFSSPQGPSVHSSNPLPPLVSLPLSMKIPVLHFSPITDARIRSISTLLQQLKRDGWKKEQETDKSEERRSEGKMQKKGKKRKAGLDGKRGQGGFVFWGFSSHETKHKTSLESDDAPVQRLDSLWNFSIRTTLSGLIKATHQPVCIFYKSLVTALLLKTMEVQIQFTSRPERPDSLIKSERQKTQEPGRRIQNKSKHHSSFRLRFSAQSVKKRLQG